MGRDINAELLSCLSDPEVTPYFLVEFYFDSGDLFLWTGTHEITIDSRTYTGAGPFLQISSLEETAAIQAAGISIALDGLDSSVVALALSEDWQARKCTLRFGAIKSDGLPTDPIISWEGSTDQMNIDGSENGIAITMAIESKLIDLKRSTTRRYTAESHKAYWPNDKAFDFVNDLQSRNIMFGGSG